jgi:hypothetical protein
MDEQWACVRQDNNGQRAKFSTGSCVFEKRNFNGFATNDRDIWSGTFWIMRRSFFVSGRVDGDVLGWEHDVGSNLNGHYFEEIDKYLSMIDTDPMPPRSCHCQSGLKLSHGRRNLKDTDSRVWKNWGRLTFWWYAGRRNTDHHLSNFDQKYHGIWTEFWSARQKIKILSCYFALFVWFRDYFSSFRLAFWDNCEQQCQFSSCFILRENLETVSSTCLWNDYFVFLRSRRDFSETIRTTLTRPIRKWERKTTFVFARTFWQIEEKWCCGVYLNHIVQNIPEYPQERSRSQGVMWLGVLLVMPSSREVNAIAVAVPDDAAGPTLGVSRFDRWIDWISNPRFNCKHVQKSEI